MKKIIIQIGLFLCMSGALYAQVPDANTVTALPDSTALQPTVVPGAPIPPTLTPATTVAPSSQIYCSQVPPAATTPDLTGPYKVSGSQSATYAVSANNSNCFTACSGTKLVKYAWSIFPSSYGSITSTSSTSNTSAINVNWSIPSGGTAHVYCVFGSCACDTLALTVYNCTPDPTPYTCVGCATTCRSYIQNIGGGSLLVSPTDNSLSISVYDVNGVAYSGFSQATQGTIPMSTTAQTTISTTGWASGIYTIQVNNSTTKAFLQELRIVK